MFFCAIQFSKLANLVKNEIERALLWKLWDIITLIELYVYNSIYLTYNLYLYWNAWQDIVILIELYAYNSTYVRITQILCV